MSFLESGLDDISISREGQQWGIPVPFDPGSVVYVWADALTNYASAVGYARDEALFTKWWPCDLHIIGKDITRFHCVIWPAMLMSAGVALPRRVFGHGFVYFRGERMSKTLGTVVDPLEAAEKFGPDPLRLYLAREIAFGQDGDFSWERFEARYNADLANNLGNLVSRIASMADKYRGGVLRAPVSPSDAFGEKPPTPASVTWPRWRLCHPGRNERGVRSGEWDHEFITASEPWVLAKDESKSDRLSQVLYDAAEATRIAAILLLPVMPSSAREILKRLGDSTAEVRLSVDAQWSVRGDLKVAKGDALWPRLEPR